MPVGDATNTGTGADTTVDPSQQTDPSAGAGAEGADAPDSEAPKTDTPADGAGEDVPAEEPAGEETLRADSGYQSSQTTTSSTSSTQSTQDPAAPMTAEDAATDSWFAKQLKGAETLSPEQQKLLGEQLQPVIDDQVDQAEALAKQLEDEQGSEKDKQQTYKKALSKATLLDQLAKKAEAKAQKLSKDSPLKEQLMNQASKMRDTAATVRRQTTAFDARQQDSKVADLSKRYQQVLKLQQQGKKLTAAQKKLLAEGKKKFPEFTAGKKARAGGLYGKSAAAQPKPGAKPGDPKAPKAEGEKPAEQASKGKTGTQQKAGKKPDLGDTPEQVAAANRAAKELVPKDVRDERLKAEREKREKIETLKTAFTEAKAELKATGEAALQKGGEVLAGVKQAGERVRQGYSQLYEDLKGGTNTVAGLVHFDGKAADAVTSTVTEGLDTAVAGARSTIQRMSEGFTGTREAVEKGMSGVLKGVRGRFDSTLESGPLARFARMYGGQGWQSRKQRQDAGEYEVGDLVTDDIGSKRA